MITSQKPIQAPQTGYANHLYRDTGAGCSICSQTLIRPQSTAGTPVATSQAAMIVADHRAIVNCHGGSLTGARSSPAASAGTAAATPKTAATSRAGAAVSVAGGPGVFGGAGGLGGSGAGGDRGVVVGSAGGGGEGG